MRPLLALIRREFTGYFLSPVGYVTLFFFLVATGVLFAGVVDGLTRSGSQGVEYPFAALFGENLFWFVFAFIPPLLTMRLLAEERGTGTLETLLTAPIRDWQVVAGKFVGAVLFYLVLWLPTLAYLPVLLNLEWTTGTSGIDPAYAWVSYLGVFLAGMMFLAIGLFVSSLVKNQLVAAMISLAACLVFVAVGYATPYLDANGWPARAVIFLSVPDHFRRDFTRGVVDTRPVVLYLSVTAGCLYLTVRSLEVRRLRA
ncbi:MAG: ABC transporter permease [Fimbriiglobus sp.]|jgi:ABC-2 type transport system permease protein|nr:ABC transporter permease [Fimbriiglobus sp.]